GSQAACYTSDSPGFPPHTTCMLETSLSLLQRLRTPGDQPAWDRFVELYTPLLFCWARRLGLQDPDTADLVQEVFALLVRKLPEFEYDPGKGFRNWLRTVTLNKGRDLLRKQAAVRAHTNEATLDAVAAVEDEPFWEAEYRRLIV